MSNITRELLFLKDSGALIGEITPDMDKNILNLDKFETLVVDIDHEAGEYWFGDFATGEVRSKNDKPIIRETIAKYHTNTRILEEYPIHKQINIVIDCIQKSDLAKTPEFVAMVDYLATAVDYHRNKIAAYQDPEVYTYISEAEEREEILKKQQFGR
jgi:hypothetical protein